MNYDEPEFMCSECGSVLVPTEEGAYLCLNEDCPEDK